MPNRKLYLFNPDHDLALANGETNYMPPASARQMAEDLALLPMWYAVPGSAVLAASAYNLDFLKQMQALLPLEVVMMTEREVNGWGALCASANASLPSADTLSPSPWGWNPALRRRLLQMGVPEVTLPSPETLMVFRRLSHRERAVELLPRLQLSEHFCGESSYLTEPADWQHFVQSHDACLLKAPLSGSGKGLNWCRGVFTPFMSGWCARVATVQGGVVGEPVYSKVEDFAMEFWADGQGGVHFAGYSLFATSSGGAYEGNWLLSDEGIEQRLSRYVPLEALRALQVHLQGELSVLLTTSFVGYLGVDMMICHFPAEASEYRVHPCVEINLRMNMGLVARLLYDRYVAAGSQGVFRVSYAPSPGEALQAHQQMEAAHPLCIENGKVVSGYLPLVPVTVRSSYRAFAVISCAAPSLSFP